jgi:hypothetical protein
MVSLLAGIGDLPTEDALIELLGPLQVIDRNLKVTDGVSHVIHLLIRVH